MARKLLVFPLVLVFGIVLSSCGQQSKPMLPTQYASFTPLPQLPFVDNGVKFDSRLLRDGDIVIARQVAEDSIRIGRYSADSLQLLWEHSLSTMKDRTIVRYCLMPDEPMQTLNVVTITDLDDGEEFEYALLSLDLQSGNPHSPLSQHKYAGIEKDRTAAKVTVSVDSNYALLYQYQLQEHAKNQHSLWLQYSMINAKGVHIDSVRLPIALDDLDDALELVVGELPGRDEMFYAATRTETGESTLHRIDLKSKKMKSLRLPDSLTKHVVTPERITEIELLRPGILQIDRNRVLYGAQRDGIRGNIVATIVDFTHDAIVASTAFDIPENLIDSMNPDRGLDDFAFRAVYRLQDRWLLVLEWDYSYSPTYKVQGSGGRTSHASFASSSSYYSSSFNIIRSIGSLLLVGFDDNLKSEYQTGIVKSRYSDYALCTHVRQSFITSHSPSQITMYYSAVENEQGLYDLKVTANPWRFERRRLLEIPKEHSLMIRHLHWYEPNAATMFVWSGLTEPETCRAYTVHLK